MSKGVLIAGRDYELRLPKKHLSFTQIDKYLRCPQQYYRSYVLSEREPVSPAQIEGLAMGMVMERVVNGLIKNKPLTLQQAVALHRRTLNKLSKTIPENNGEDIEPVHTRAAIFLDVFWSQELEHLKPEAAECSKIIEIAGVPVMVICDLLERNYIIDFKVSGSSWFMDPDKSLQLSLYAHAWQRQKVGFMVFDKKARDRAKMVELKKSYRDLKQTEKWLELIVGGVAHGISQGVFPVCNPANNNLCSEKFCAFWSTCYGQYV